MKKLLIIMYLAIMCISCFSVVEAKVSGGIINDEAMFDNGGSSSSTERDYGMIEGVTGLVDRVWATATTVVQVLAVGCVVFAGLRYMYASADRKADIKKGMMYLAIGAVFVFATATVMKFIYNVGNSIM